MKFLTVLLATLFAVAAQAGPGLWHQPERDGHGISISQPTEGGHSVIWYTYRSDRSTAFLVAEPCPEFPCATVLYEPSAAWLGGDLDMGEPVGSLELTPHGDKLRIDFDLYAWDLERCSGISPGGVIFRECVGKIELTRLAE